MKLARLRIGASTVLVSVNGERVTPLVVQQADQWHDPLRSWMLGQHLAPGRDVVSLHHGTFLSPVRHPSKIVCVGLNYRDHIAERIVAGREEPEQPLLFSKAPSSLLGHGGVIRFSARQTRFVDYETELGVVIGKRTYQADEAAALDAIFGYTIANDVTARDAQQNDGQFFRSKSFDTFCPLGPFVVTTDEIADPQNLTITTLVNHEVVQHASTSHMIHSVARIISYISTFMTLEPGDVICTGTPSGVGMARVPPQTLRSGDLVECRISQIGSLRNTVDNGAPNKDVATNRAVP